jgi:hypothetical protein
LPAAAGEVMMLVWAFAEGDEHEGRNFEIAADIEGFYTY